MFLTHGTRHTISGATAVLINIEKQMRTSLTYHFVVYFLCFTPSDALGNMQFGGGSTSGDF